MDTLIHHIRQGLSSVELVHIPQNRWPLPRRSSNKKSLRISILDSSFNPPTLAHLSIANIPSFPHATTGQSDTSDTDCSTDFDAKLLLLSVRNVDKSLKPGDATYVQRLEMMVLLAQDMQKSSKYTQNTNRNFTENDEDRDNVAVAIIDEPTFVGKSRMLLEFIHKRVAMLDSKGPDDAHLVSPALQLTFLVGIDTLERILSPRYYATEKEMHQSLHQFLSPDGDDSRIICARRVISGTLDSQNEQEARIMHTADTVVAHDRIALVDIPEDVRGLSSSEVRQRIRLGDSLWKTMLTEKIVEYVVKQQLYLS